MTEHGERQLPIKGRFELDLQVDLVDNQALTALQEYFLEAAQRVRGVDRLIPIAISFRLAGGEPIDLMGETPSHRRLSPNRHGNPVLEEAMRRQGFKPGGSCETG